MDIDPTILAAKAVADAKHRHLKPCVKPAATDIMGIRPPDSSYCKVCDYPLDESAPGGCRFCYEQKLADKEKLNGWIEAIGGRKAWEDYTLARYIITPNNQAAVLVAQSFDRRTQNLFFYGPRGTGKSHAAAIAKRPLVTAGAKVLTVSMPQIMDEVLAGIKSGGFATLTQQWLKTLIAAPVLSVEDLAVEKPSDHTLGFYYKFINGRYEAKRNGMIITCNYSLDDLENRWAVADAHGRVVSRLKELCRGHIVSFSGSPDYREAA